MLDDLKIKDLLKLVNLIRPSYDIKTFFEIGKCYFIRTITMHLIGKIIDISEKKNWRMLLGLQIREDFITH